MYNFRAPVGRGGQTRGNPPPAAPASPKTLPSKTGGHHNPPSPLGRNPASAPPQQQPPQQQQPYIPVSLGVVNSIIQHAADPNRAQTIMASIMDQQPARRDPSSSSFAVAASSASSGGNNNSSSSYTMANLRHSGSSNTYTNTTTNAAATAPAPAANAAAGGRVGMGQRAATSTTGSSSSATGASAMASNPQISGSGTFNNPNPLGNNDNIIGSFSGLPHGSGSKATLTATAMNPPNPAITRGGVNTRPVSAHNARTRPPPTGAGVITVGTFNVLNQIHYEKYAAVPAAVVPLQQRMVALTTLLMTIIHSNPNLAVLCLQEVHPVHMKMCFDELGRAGWKVILSSSGGRHPDTDCVAICFRIALLQLVGNPSMVGFPSSSGHAAASGKVGLKQLFQHVHTNVLFAVASVHLPWERDDKHRADRMRDLERGIVTQPGNYIICGDFNIDNKANYSLMSHSLPGFTDATSGVGWTSVARNATHKIDYIFYSGANIKPVTVASGASRSIDPASNGRTEPQDSGVLIDHEAKQLQRNAFPSDHALVMSNLVVAA